MKDELVFIFLSANREFYLIDENDMKSTYFAKDDYKNSSKLTITSGGFIKKSFFGSSLVEFDCAINLCHGADGEDGKLGSILEFFGINFIGPRIEASVMSFNKIYTKKLADIGKLKFLKYMSVSKIDRDRAVNDNTVFPLIVKPARLGSSIGVSIVKNKSELDYALDVAFEFDEDVLLEPFIEGVKEYNLAGCFAKEFILSSVEEPQKNEFLDFDKKYKDFSRTQKVYKADISPELELKIQEEFKKVYNLGFAGSLIRCDFFVINGEVCLNEINPIPGSMANYLFDDFNAVINKLATNLPKSKKITVEYKYINEIASAKGKA
jgi:D-alanine-D-alanine ligase